MIKNHLYTSSDYDRILYFLREAYELTHTQYCWLPARFEYAEYNSNPLYLVRGWRDWKEFMRIWEDDGHIVAIANKESGYDAFLQIKPGYEFLAEVMIDHLESVVPKEIPQKYDDKHILTFCINGKQSYAAQILQNRGYIEDMDVSYNNYQELTPEYFPSIARGYRLVDGNEISDQNARRMVVHLGFHPEDEPSTPPAIQMVMEQAPMFRPDLEIMTQHIETGQLCSFCLIWFDEVLKIGYFEPVCTRLQFRHKGLASAMISEGLSRLKAIGATKAYVGAYGEERKQFYANNGFQAYDADVFWKKPF